GRDTLVSVGADGWSFSREMFADEQDFAVYEKRSIIDPTKPEYQNAISEEDYVFAYFDTNTINVDEDYFGRPHIPLHMEITQKSYAWSYAYAEDFVLFDYEIRNIGPRPLENVYMGFYVDADVCPGGIPCVMQGHADDICGFVEKLPVEVQRGDTFDLTVNLAWIADNDGKFVVSEGDPVPHVTAMRIVRTPATFLDVSFNWWISNGNAALDFGPREKPFIGRLKEPYREIGTGGRGTPEGDVNKYYFLRNKEFDYGQIFSAEISSLDTLWMPCASGAVSQEMCEDFADGYDTRYLLSFGPFDIDQGQRLPISFAYLAGENFHTDRSNLNNLPDNPQAYYNNLNFEDLGLNSVWASWIYDNPGVDTDGDGYAGINEIRIRDSTVVRTDTIVDSITGDTTFIHTYADVDTIWLEGDGVPDFKGATPPPAPEFWIEPSVGSLTVRFNGLRSETTRDVFSGETDFEGYRVYLARDERATSYSVVTSYDREDYNKFLFDDKHQEWVLLDVPFSIEQLRCLYGDSCTDVFFDPLRYTLSEPFRFSGTWGDSLFYFVPQDFNRSGLGLPHGIRKKYPDQPFPSHLDPDSARSEEVTSDRYLKYFEYEFVIDNLLPTVPYWVNVSAFDYGSPASGLPSLETSKTVGAKSAYPLSSAQDVMQQGLKVLVYPNPYRLNAGYRTLGYEGRSTDEQTSGDDYVRAIHFANLPPKCKIRIYSLDGDLVREISHDVNPSDPNASHETWDMITRNTQLVVSGLYYWSVESEDGSSQLGKLAIIM
ncbi:MAG TPA: hypothetical protein VN285_07215, partial [Candidatus Deferrimicrobium sp.]|nr:hypothetical protein [Candidatus Deferrimicrobium sp.]